MIVVHEVCPNKINTQNLQKHTIEIEWYEAAKTIMRKKTNKGLEVGIKKNNRTPLQDGDIIYYDDKLFVEIEIKPCDCIVVQPKDIVQMGIICFEIGNMHLPIYIDNKQNINIAYEAPLYDFLLRNKYQVNIENKKLLQTQMLTLHQIKR